MFAPVRWLPLLVVGALAGGWGTQGWAQAESAPTATNPYLIGRLDGHAEAVLALKFLPDGQQLLTGSEDKSLRAWSTSDWKPLGTYHVQPFGDGAQPAAIRAIDVGRRNPLIVAAQSKGIFICPRDTYDLHAWVSTGGADLTAIGFSPDEQWIAVAGGASVAMIALSNYYEDNQLVLRGPDKTPLKVISTDGTVRSFAFLDSKRIAICQEQQQGPPVVEIFDVESGKGTGTRIAGSTVACSPDGKTLATDRVLVDAKTLRVRGQLANAHTANVISFSGNGKWFATGGRDGRLMMWDTASGSRLGVVDAHLRQVRALAVSPDGKSIVSSGTSHAKDLTPKIWNAAKILADKPQPPEKIVNSEHPIDFARFTTDGKLDLESTAQRTVWDLGGKGAPAVPKSEKFAGADFDPIDLLFVDLVHANGELRARVAGDGPSLQLWNASSKRAGVAIALPYSDGEVGEFAQPFQGARVSPDGTTVAVYESFDEPYVHLFDTASGELRGTLRPNLELVSAMDFSPDGRELAVVGDPRTSHPGRRAELWNVQHRTCVGVVEVGDKYRGLPPESLQFSPNGDTILTGPLLIDRSTLKVRAVLGEGDRAAAAAIQGLLSAAMPDSAAGWVVTNSSRAITFWDAHTGRMLKQVDVPVCEAEATDVRKMQVEVLVSPDGKNVAVVDRPGQSVLVYEVHEILADVAKSQLLAGIDQAAEVVALANAISSMAVSTGNPELSAHFRARAAALAKRLKLDLQLPDAVPEVFKYLVSVRVGIGGQLNKLYGSKVENVFVVALDVRVLSRQYAFTGGKRVSTAQDAYAETRAALGLPEDYFAGPLAAMNGRASVSDVLSQCRIVGRHFGEQVAANGSLPKADIAFDHAAFYNEMADLLSDEKDLYASIAYRTRAIYELEAVQAESAELRSRRGRAYRQSGLFSLAKQDYERALEIDSQHLDALNELSALLASCPDATLRDRAKSARLAEALEKRRAELELPPLDATQAADAATPLVKSLEDVPHAAECWRLFDLVMTSVRRQVQKQQPTFADELGRTIEMLELEPLKVPQSFDDQAIRKYLDGAKNSLGQQIAKRYGPKAAELFNVNALLHFMLVVYEPKNEAQLRAFRDVFEKGIQQVSLPADQVKELTEVLSRGASRADLRRAINSLRGEVNRQLLMAAA